VRPEQPIPAEATAIHGITHAMVACAPAFSALYEPIAGREVVVHNADYDRSVLDGVCDRHGLPRLEARRWTCAMEW
jgi:DNA polymerase-3 subunit epsilon